MYIYSKRHYLSFSGKYAWGILGVWLGYAWARVRTAPLNGSMQSVLMIVKFEYFLIFAIK